VLVIETRHRICKFIVRVYILRTGLPHTHTRKYIRIHIVYAPCIDVDMRALSLSRACIDSRVFLYGRIEIPLQTNMHTRT